MKSINLRTDELCDAVEFLDDFNSNSEYQKHLQIVLDTLDFALVRVDSLKESLDIVTNRWLDLYNEQKNR